jgi:hypothetical protein
VNEHTALSCRRVAHRKSAHAPNGAERCTESSGHCQRTPDRTHRALLHLSPPPRSNGQQIICVGVETAVNIPNAPHFNETSTMRLIDPSQHNGYYMYIPPAINEKKICILPTECICVFRKVLTTNRGCFLKPIGLCRGGVMCFL